jgi:ATP-dependent RNA helicase SUPV3L1/SUV3
LKPAPTRLRLVLWSLAKGLQEFPESPPPGLVTIPNVEGLPDGTYVMSGYFQAGARAIRIDMLERLADQLRTQDTRAGFEAKADMLSITGMTLDQFAGLMAGLGYEGTRGEREKVKVAPEKPRELTAEEVLAEAAHKAALEAGEVVVEAETGPEMEVFYSFVWKPKPRPRPDRAADRGPRRDLAPKVEGEASQGQPQDSPRDQPRDQPQGQPRQGKSRREQHSERPEGKPNGKAGGGAGRDRNDKRDERPRKGKPERRDRNEGARIFSTGPSKSDKIDPDNPFAVLAALKDKS